jgi:hypothetical protein
MREANHDLVQNPPSISSWLNTEMARPTSGAVKTGPSDFPGSGQYFYCRKLIQQPIQDTAVTKFRRLGSSSIGASSSALLPNQATNAWAMGASANDVSALSTLDKVVRSVDSASNAFSPRVTRTSWRFWLQRLPRRRQPLQRCRPAVD